MLSLLPHWTTHVEPTTVLTSFCFNTEWSRQHHVKLYGFCNQLDPIGVFSSPSCPYQYRLKICQAGKSSVYTGMVVFLHHSNHTNNIGMDAMSFHLVSLFKPKLNFTSRRLLSPSRRSIFHHFQLSHQPSKRLVDASSVNSAPHRHAVASLRLGQLMWFSKFRMGVNCNYTCFDLKLFFFLTLSVIIQFLVVHFC